MIKIKAEGDIAIGNVSEGNSNEVNSNQEMVLKNIDSIREYANKNAIDSSKVDELLRLSKQKESEPGSFMKVVKENYSWVLDIIKKSMI